MAERTRRATLRLVAGTAIAAGLPVPLPAAGPMVPDGDDPHPAWFAEWKACLDWCDTPGVTGGRDLISFPLYHRALELEELIHGTPARTLAGVAAQPRVLARWHGEETSLNERDSAGLAHAIGTLERLAGEARA